MRLNRFRLRKGIKTLCILLFILVLPIVFNTYIFSSINIANQDNREEIPFGESPLSISSSSLPNADFFDYYKVITIDHTKVSGTGNHINFPVLISILDLDLHDKAQSDGDDIAFANSTSWLDYEIELYNPSYTVDEAQLIAWVRIPFLSTSVDTILFMFYGNSTMGSQENPTGVWDTNYKGVWHLKEDPDLGFPGDIKDSTINGNHATAHNMESTDMQSGPIGISFNFNGWDEYLSVGNVGPEIKTVEFWVNPDTLENFESYNTGYQSPAATGDDYNQWTNPTYAYASDGNRASEYTNYEDQDWYNFDFNIPAEATIEGILVSIEGSTSVQYQSTGCRVRLSSNGGSTYTNYQYQSWSYTYDSYKSVGSSTDTWGWSWSPSDFSNSNFRVRLEKTGSYSAALRVDHIRINVYYSFPTDIAVIDFDGTDQISIDHDSGEIKAISFPGATTIYLNGAIGSTVTVDTWQHVVITNTTGITASALDIARNSSVYFDGIIDEVRLSNVVRSPSWIATEYNNQENPSGFFSVGTEETPFTDIQVNTIDSFGNKIPSVNISMIKGENIIRSEMADDNGLAIFEDVISIRDRYNFSVSMKSNIEPYHTIVINRTTDGILIEGSLQTINLICNISRNIFNIVDIDGNAVDSGWIIVGNSSDSIQNCTIDDNGQAIFRWLNIIPYEYNFTMWYRDPNYNPNKLILETGNINTPNYDVNITVPLTTVNFTVLTFDSPFTPIDGAKLILENLNSGQSIVNLTTDLTGQAKLRWVDSSFISSNYSLVVSFYGQLWDFEIPELMTGRVGKANFTITTSTAYTIEIHFAPAELEELETKLVSLNPTNDIIAEWGSKIKLRALLNVTKVPSGFENLIGPAYADSMEYQIFEGTTLIQSKIMPTEDDYIGRHKGEIQTDKLETETFYILKIVAEKSGYVIPPDIIMSLRLLENELVLNQSQNDDSPQSVYWQESIDLSVKPYGEISESFTLEYGINDYMNQIFEFSVPDIEEVWNLSQITFNIYNISWNALPDDINITIALNDYGIFRVFNTSNHNGHNYALGTWTGIKLNIDKSNPTGYNNFDFVIGGSFDGTIDIIADAVFIRDKINVQYSRFNITEAISILPPGKGWAIKNITFELYNCYNTSNWSELDPLNDAKLNISTNEGIKYPLDSGSLGSGKLNIQDRIIYPLDNQFLFTMEANPDFMFDVIIKVAYIQEFYQNQYLEVINFSIPESNFNKGGTLQVNLIEKEWIEDYTRLEISEITDGFDYFLPSELAMNITINGEKYSINDVLLGQGIFSLESLDKNTIYSAFIETNQVVTFNLLFIVKYSRIITYETEGIVTYLVVEKPEISGMVPYYEELGYYLQSIDTSLLDANPIGYNVNFTIFKEHYRTETKVFDLTVLSRLTLLNGSSGFFRKIENIFINDAVNFTFLYTDAENGTKITDLTSNNYIWEKYDTEGNVIESGQGTLIQTVDNLYLLDFNTENLAIGEYFLIVTLGKKNYEYRIAIISLTIEKRNVDYSLSDNFKNNQVSVEKGKTVTIEIELKESGISIINATVILKIGGTEYEFQHLGNGTYIYYFSTKGIDTFFSSKTLNGIINITKEDYNSIEFRITIVVEMEEIFPGMPTFYFLLILAAAAVFTGSIVAYRVYKHARIPEFVKKVRSIKKAIKGEDDISDSLIYRNKEIFVGEIVKTKWDKLKLPLVNIVGSNLEKVKKVSKVKRSVSILGKTHDHKPIGLALMRWNERIGTEILAKYPEDMNLTTKTLMQVYSTHEYSGEKGIITLMDSSLNIVSYYTGPEAGYYFLLILNIEDDPDLYESGMADTLHIILQNLEDEAYIQLMPSLFQRLSVYPTLNEEQLYILDYSDNIKRMIINILRDTGVVAKSELIIWLKDTYKEGFIDIDAVLSELMKRGIIKQISVKGMPSELILLAMDIFMLRVPPNELLENPAQRGLPTQLVKSYKNEVKKFFNEYHPTEEDNLKILNVIAKPPVYETLKLLRTAIVTRKDLEKLKKKGVDDIYGVLKMLWDNELIKVFQDENKNEYYALLSNFYLDVIFPKYILTNIKESYEQKSKANKVLIEYLNVLEESYFNLKSQEKSKD